MATPTVTTKNFQTIWDCESVTGAVGNKPVLEGEIKKQGSNSVGFTMSTVGSNNRMAFDGSYHYSPPVADIIAEYDSLKAVVRVAPLPVVFIGWLSLKFGYIFILITTFLFTYGTIYMIRKK